MDYAIWGPAETSVHGRAWSRGLPLPKMHFALEMMHFGAFSVSKEAAV